MRTLEFTIVGLSDAQLRRRRRPTRARTGLVLALVASLLWLAAPHPPLKFADLQFGDVATGAKSPPQVVTPDAGFNSFRGAHGALHGAGASQFRLTSGCTTFPFNPPNSCEVRFQPTTAGTHTATFELADEAQHVISAFAVLGRGVPTPRRKPITFPDVRFSAQQSGTRSPSQVVTLDLGQRSFRSGRAAFHGGDASQFGLSPGCNDRSFTGKSSCTVEIYFSPTSDGEHGTKFELADKSGQLVGTFQVSGRGVSASAQVDRKELNFSAPYPSEQKVVVGSAGEAPLVISNAYIDRDSESRFKLEGQNANCIQYPLQNGASCTLKVSYRQRPALTVVAATGRLVIEHNAAGTPNEVLLRYTQTLRPRLSSKPPSVEFDDVTQRIPIDIETMIVNNGLGATTDLSVNLEQAGGPFAILRNDCTAALEPQGQCVVTIRFTPIGHGEFVNTLVVSSATSDRLLIKVHGSSAEPQMTTDGPANFRPGIDNYQPPVNVQ